MTGQSVRYAQDDKSLIGYYVAAADARASVLVVPEAPGLGPMPRHRADMLAAMGYNALALDLYGDGHFEGLW